MAYVPLMYATSMSMSYLPAGVPCKVGNQRVVMKVRSYESHKLCFIAPCWGPLLIENGTRNNKIETFFMMRSETMYITSGLHDALL